MRKLAVFLAGLVILLFCAAGLYRSFSHLHRAVQTVSYPSGYATLVIDAGHGGPDGGAVGKNGTVEKGINLSVALRCELLMELSGVRTVMTRREDLSLDGDESLSIAKKKVADMKKRVEIVKKAESPVLLSIHMNSFPASKYSGAQVFYSKNNERSKTFADLLQGSLVAGVDPANTRIAKQSPNDIYLMKSMDCPAVIVECGFLSNPTEEALLRTDDYQKKLAVSISAATIRFVMAGE